MNIKKICLILVVVAILLGFGVALLNVNHNENSEEVVASGNNNIIDHTVQNQKINIVASNFASYDFLRAIIGNVKGIELKFLLGPGKDAHSYDPTAQDLITMQNADLLVYIGGEMEGWADRVIDTLDSKDIDIFCIADFVETMEEKEVDGAEEEEEEEEEESAFDEHIWTSPENAIKMVKALETEMCKIDTKNSGTYRVNAENYIAKIQEVDNQIQNIVDNKVRDRLVFGDKMPMQYFIDYYGLEVSAAFDGCSTETEPSAKTIAYLQDKAKEEKIPVILYIELNDGRVAKVIASEVGNGCKALQIQSLHNVSLNDFNNGETWVSLMTKNVDVLKEALQ